jgi:hypothetical protein
MHMSEKSTNRRMKADAGQKKWARKNGTASILAKSFDFRTLLAAYNLGLCAPVAFFLRVSDQLTGQCGSEPE